MIFLRKGLFNGGWKIEDGGWLKNPDTEICF
jgi:hypothetical protein